jgi:uncharacterized protein (UPF0335 family)
MSKAGPIAADRLLSFFERIERLVEERDAIGSDIKEVFSEAKSVGYDTKTMRKVLALRKLDPADRDEQEALIDTYMHALGMIDRVEARVASGEPITRATEDEGYSRATYYRVSQRRAEATNETVHDPASGEILEGNGAGGLQAEAGPALTNPCTTLAGDVPVTSSTVDIRNLPPHTVTPTAWGLITSSRDEHEAAWKAEAEAKEAARLAAIEQRKREREEERERNRRIDADDLAIPDYLRRVPA